MIRTIRIVVAPVVVGLLDGGSVDDSSADTEERVALTGGDTGHEAAPHFRRIAMLGVGCERAN